MQYRIEGSTMQTLILELSRGDAAFSEAGCLLMMSAGIRMSTSTGGGVGGMLGRMLTGNSIFLNVFESTGSDEQVMFTTRMPGHILSLDMRTHRAVIVENHAFLCAEQGVEYRSGFTLKLGRFLGGNGMIFNRLSGDGMAFVSIDGETVDRELAGGESILVHPGHIAAFTDGVHYKAELMRGVRNLLFGSDGLYLIRLTGPGHVWMHSLSIHNLQEILTAGK